MHHRYSAYYEPENGAHLRGQPRQKFMFLVPVIHRPIDVCLHELSPF
jgi:hypothetical protein